MSHKEASQAFGGLLALDGVLGNVGLGCSVSRRSPGPRTTAEQVCSTASRDFRRQPVQEYARHLQRRVSTTRSLRFLFEVDPTPSLQLPRWLDQPRLLSAFCPMIGLFS